MDLDVGGSSDLAGMNSSSSAASVSPSQQSVKLPSFPRIDLSNVSDGDILRPLSSEGEDLVVLLKDSLFLVHFSSTI